MTDMPYAGRLENTPFAEIAGLLFREKKTGILTLASPKKERKVVFYEGHPVAVLSSDPREHIARFLAVKNKVSKEEAEQLLLLPETKEALQSSEILTKELLSWGLKFRFVNLSYDFFRWTEGSFSFEEQPPPRDIFLMKVPAPSLLTKGTKHMSPSLLMEKIPGSYQIAPGSVSGEDVGPLGNEETAFLRDCREGRLVREVLEDNSVAPPRARELLYAFTSLGLLSLEPVPEPEEEPEKLDLEDAAMGMPPAGQEDEDAAAGDAETGMELEFDGSPAAGEAKESIGGEEPSPGPEGFDREEQPGGDEESAALELDPGPTAFAEESPAAEEAPAMEIERHSYGEESPTEETAAGPDDETPPGLEFGEAAPLSEPVPIGLEDEGAPSLEPPPLEAPSADEELPPLDGGELPSPDDSPGLPPPPWQEQDDSGGAQESAGIGESGISPFSPPSSEGRPKASRREIIPGDAEKKPSGPLAKVVTLIALVGAAAVVVAGVWMGWQSLRSPSTPLEPIPEAENVTGNKMAEDLPIPALPTSVKKAVRETGPAGKSSPETAQRPAPKAAASSTPAPSAGGGDFYGAGYAAFLAGELDDAADAWLSGLKSAGASHTIQVEVACVGDTVRNDVKRFGEDRQVFAVPLSLKGRSCYRVLLGAFASGAEAAAALDNLPPTLKKGLSVRAVQGIY